MPTNSSRLENYQLRAAVSADAALAWQIRKDAIIDGCQHHYSVDVLTRWTDGDEVPNGFRDDVAKHYQVITVAERVIATGKVNLVSGAIDAIFVDPQWTGNGIGRMMMAHLERLAQQAGLVELSLDATLNAAPFYRRCGFVGNDQSQYHSPRGFSLACVPMTKKLV